jgi:short-subunit dehydrogenase
MEKAIIIGATSGIGRALAEALDAKGYAVGITGRRVELLDEVLDDLSDPAEAEPVDVTETEEARQHFDALVERLGGVDLVILSAGVGYTDEAESWLHVRQTVETAETGHLVGISSVAAVRENGAAPAYHASKTFVSRYLAGLRHRAAQAGLPIAVTDVRPGFVDTAMAKGDGLFWVATPERAASQIIRAIKRQRRTAYVTRRWRAVAALLKMLPGWLYRRVV